MIFDWVNEEAIPYEIMEPLEFFMKNILLLDPEKSSAFFNADALCVEFDSLIIKLPKRLRDKYAETIYKREAAGR